MIFFDYLEEKLVMIKKVKKYHVNVEERWHRSTNVYLFGILIYSQINQCTS